MAYWPQAFGKHCYHDSRMNYHVIPSCGRASLLVYIKVAPRGTKSINMTGYYFGV